MMPRYRRRCEKGRRLVAFAPGGHWRTTTFIAALRQGRITAPGVFDRPINGGSFLAYVRQVLVPTLSPGAIAVMDHLGADQAAGVREAIAAAGAKLLYLPPYSPDFEPIEQLFAKLKHKLRQAARRTVDALWDATGIVLHDFPPGECFNYFLNAGYDST